MTFFDRIRVLLWEAGSTSASNSQMISQSSNDPAPCLRGVSKSTLTSYTQDEPIDKIGLFVRKHSKYDM